MIRRGLGLDLVIIFTTMYFGSRALSSSSLPTYIQDSPLSDLAFCWQSSPCQSPPQHLKPYFGMPSSDRAMLSGTRHDLAGARAPDIRQGCPAPISQFTHTLHAAPAPAPAPACLAGWLSRFGPLFSPFRYQIQTLLGALSLSARRSSGLTTRHHILGYAFLFTAHLVVL